MAQAVTKAPRDGRSFRVNSNNTQIGLRLFAAMSIALVTVVVSAQDNKGQGKPKTDSSKTQTQVSRTGTTKLSVSQKNEALKFARKHHPELANLLERLQGKAPSGFARGIREVHLATQRLERFREKQPGRFESELANWKTDSEIRLLTAKWAMSQDPALEKQIRELLRTRQRSRINRLVQDRVKLAARLQQLDAQIGMGTEELEIDLVDEWNRLAKQATTRARSQRRSTRKKTVAKTESATTPGKSREARPQSK